MALLNEVQFFSCSPVKLSSVLIRSMFASLLATICSPVSCGSPAWVNTTCLVSLRALVAFAVFAELGSFASVELLAAGGAGCSVMPTPHTPAHTPTPAAQRPPHTASPGPAPAVPSCG